MLDVNQGNILKKLVEADGSDFASLVKIAGLDPARDFRGVDLRGVDFGKSNLRGFDFTNADLRNARLDRAKTAGAIFDGVLDGGTVWPQMTGAERNRTEQGGHQLSLNQSEALEAIQVAILKLQQKRVLVSMPDGTGGGMVIIELINRLMGDRDFRKVVLAVENAEERSQYQFRLRSTAPLRLASSPLDIFNGSDEPNLQIVTTQSIRNALSKLQGVEYPESYQADAMIVVGNIHRLSALLQQATIRRLARVIICMTYLPDRKIEGSMGDQINELRDLFGAPVMMLRLEEAVYAGVLRETIVEDRKHGSKALAGMDGGPTGADISGSLGRIVEDVASVIIDRYWSEQCLVICSNISVVEAAASQLQEIFRSINAPEKKQIVAVTSRAPQRELWTTVQRQGVVLLMTPQMALRAPKQLIWDSTLSAVLAKVEFPLAERMLYRPTQNQSRRDLILDYSGSFGGLFGVC